MPSGLFVVFSTFLTAALSTLLLSKLGQCCAHTHTHTHTHLFHSESHGPRRFSSQSSVHRWPPGGPALYRGTTPSLSHLPAPLSPSSGLFAWWTASTHTHTHTHIYTNTNTSDLVTRTHTHKNMSKTIKNIYIKHTLFNTHPSILWKTIHTHPQKKMMVNWMMNIMALVMMLMMMMVLLRIKALSLWGTLTTERPSRVKGSACVGYCGRCSSAWFSWTGSPLAGTPRRRTTVEPAEGMEHKWNRRRMPPFFQAHETRC